MKAIKWSVLTLVLFSLALSCDQKKQNHQNANEDQNELEKSSNKASTDHVSTSPPVKIAYDQLDKMSKSDLRIARNTIFARYGRAFKSADLQNHFKSQPWYKVNPDYTDALLSDDEKNVIDLIACWENSSKVFWEKQVDLDNDNTLDHCYLLKGPENSKKLHLVINDQVLNFDLYVDENDDEYPFTLKAEIVDIDKSDDHKEIWISQGYEGIEDPGYENIFISKVNNEWIQQTLGSPGSVGKITFLEDAKLELNASHSCALRTQTYQLIENELKLIDEETKPINCAACFIADSKVLINANNDYELIKNLKVGDPVLTYDLATRQQYQTAIVGMVEVKHQNLVELYFRHDTLTSTDDHPYYVHDKGWSSFKPNATLNNYSNYDRVSQITKGDYFILSNDEKCQLMGYAYLDQERNTYTITQLENGNTFYVNGVLVGVEEINKDATGIVLQ